MDSRVRGPSGASLFHRQSRSPSLHERRTDSAPEKLQFLHRSSPARLCMPPLALRSTRHTTPFQTSPIPAYFLRAVPRTAFPSIRQRHLQQGCIPSIAPVRSDYRTRPRVVLCIPLHWAGPIARVGRAIFPPSRWRRRTTRCVGSGTRSKLRRTRRGRAQQGGGRSRVPPDWARKRLD